MFESAEQVRQYYPLPNSSNSLQAANTTVLRGNSAIAKCLPVPRATSPG